MVKSSGFDYEDGTNAMLIYLSTSSVTDAMPFVIAMLDDEVVHGNRLAEAAKVGISELSPKETTSTRWSIRGAKRVRSSLEAAHGQKLTFQAHVH
ncbi:MULTISPECIES: hypothetical protein [unclassified Variovorax]|uniref:hypothetical protein n=1 Tax=unclassified Variovorax TaxID=663243 RepID=UPI003ECE4D72